MVGKAPESNQNTEQTFLLKSIFVLCLRSFSWTGDHAGQSGAGEAGIVWVLQGCEEQAGPPGRHCLQAHSCPPGVLVPMKRALPESQGWSTRDEQCGALQRWSTSPAGLHLPIPIPWGSTTSSNPTAETPCIPREHPQLQGPRQPLQEA